MIAVREEDIDRITALFHRVLKGEVPRPLDLPNDCPDGEIKQVVEYANRFVAEYQALAAAMSALLRGDLDLNVPAGKTHVLQSFKNLHANLRHLTWKTQQIAGGDLSQRVDFMGDFSTAFNSMTQQLREAFAKIERQNQDLARANQRMKRDLDAAARVQRTLLPEGFPHVEGLDFAWTYRPCDELAGDALNIVRINDDLIALYLLDVSGHGVPAALLSVTVTRNLHPRGGRAFARDRPRREPGCRRARAGGRQAERTVPDGIERRPLLYDDLRTFGRPYATASLHGCRTSRANPRPRGKSRPTPRRDRLRDRHVR